MVNATCDTNDLMEKVDATCEISDLVKLVDIKDTMVDDSLSSHDKEWVKHFEFLNKNYEDESRTETQSGSNNNECINEGHYQVQLDISKRIARPWE